MRGLKAILGYCVFAALLDVCPNQALAQETSSEALSLELLGNDNNLFLSLAKKALH
jgi:hypothetical protein